MNTELFNNIQKIRERFDINSKISFKYTKEELSELVLLHKRIYEIENKIFQQPLPTEDMTKLCLMFFFFIKFLSISMPYTPDMLFVDDYIPADDSYLTDLGIHRNFKILFKKYKYEIAYLILQQQDLYNKELL